MIQKNTNNFITIAIFILLMINPAILISLSGKVYLSLFISFSFSLIGTLLSHFLGLRIKVWIVNICAIIGILLFSEFVFAKVFPDRNIPNLYKLHGKYYFNKPFLDTEFDNNEFTSTYKTNADGYRIGETNSPIDSVKQCDWLFIGDSFTQGAQVDYSEIYTSLLYRYFPDKVIMNAGISGAGVYDELNYFKDMGKNLHPKVVFLQVGVFNDFYNVKERYAKFSDYMLEWSDFYRYLYFNTIEHTELPLHRWCEPFFDNDEDNTRSNIMYKKTCNEKENDKKAFADCISAFKSEVESIGAELILVLIPSKEQVSDKMLNEVLVNFNIDKNDLDMMMPNRLCESISTNEGLKYIDLYDVFRESEVFPFFYQDEHMNYVGHQLVAKGLTDALKEFHTDIECFSQSNSHDRYPTIFDNYRNVLYQSQDGQRHVIRYQDIATKRMETLWSSSRELIHPSISSDLHYFIVTEGHQEEHKTDVFLFDNINSTRVKINKEQGQYAAIPSFSHDSKKVVFPSWRDNISTNDIEIYDIQSGKTIASFSDGIEVWRPIFSINDEFIYYIQKDKVDEYFKVKSYNIKTKQKKVIIKMPYDIWDISLSPSGEKLAFAGRKNSNWDIFIYSFESKTVKQITHTLGDEWDPSFGENDNDIWFAGEFGFNDGIFHKSMR